jgi:uncharacterized membrane protein YpjA
MKKSKLIWFLIIVNVIGFLFGAYYYQNQLSRTPLWAWLLVIDCPLFAILFALTLLFDVENSFINFFVSVGVIKYGLWTVFVIALLWEQFLFISPVMYPLLAIAHTLMAAEFIFLIPRIRPSKWNFFTILLFLAMDYFDYFWSLHPWLPPSAPIDFIMQVTVASSSIIPVFLTMVILLYQWRLKVIWELESPQTRKKASARYARRKQKSGKSSTRRRKKASASAKSVRTKVN